MSSSTHFKQSYNKQCSIEYNMTSLLPFVDKQALGCDYSLEIGSRRCWNSTLIAKNCELQLLLVQNLYTQWIYTIRIPKRAISLSGKDPTILTKPKYSPKPPNKSHYKAPKPNGTPSTHTSHSSLSQKRTLTRNVISDEDEEEDLLNETDSDDSVQALKLRKSSTRKRLRPPPANDLEPNPKRRRTNNNHNDHEPKLKKKRRSKGPKARFCTICKAKLHADNHGKYCGELCKKEGANQNKQKRADEKKQRVEKEEALEAKKEKAADKANKDNIRKTTACKFRAIFAGDNKAGSNLEKRIYKFAGSEINDVYSQKVKELRYNLSENSELLESVLSGELTLKKLSTMNNDELACKSLVQDRKQREAKFNAENTLVHKPVFGKPMEGKHFADNITDNDTNMDIDEHLNANASVSASVSVSAMSPTPTALSSLSTTSTLSTPSITVSDTEKKVAVFDAHEMSELLKNCKTKMKEIESKKEEDMPLQIHVDSSEEEEVMEDDDIEVSVLEPPEPPRMNPSYYSHNKVARSNSNARNVWNGWIKRSSSDVAFDLSLFFIGGKETKLKAVIPKRLQINGRTKFKVISDCLSDLVKVTRSKFTVILAAKCVDDAYRSEYAEIIKECRESKKGFMIDMKQSKARIKIILLPRFRHSDKEWFDVAEMQKLWKCSLPATDDLWALLTVYAKDRDKDSDKEREKTPEKGNNKYNKWRHESNSSNLARKDKHRDRDRNRSNERDRDRDRKRDRERDKHRNSYKRRESYTYTSKSNERARDRDSDRDSERDRDRTHYRDHRGDRNKDKRNKYQYKEDRYDENKRPSLEG